MFGALQSEICIRDDGVKSRTIQIRTLGLNHEDVGSLRGSNRQHAVGTQGAEIRSWHQLGISNELQRPNLAQVLLGLLNISHVHYYSLSISNGQLMVMDNKSEQELKAKQPVQFIVLFTLCERIENMNTMIHHHKNRSR